LELLAFPTRRSSDLSSREHAALAPRFLGLRVALVKDFARIHWQNLVNFGILPLTFADDKDYERLEQNDVLIIDDVKEKITTGNEFYITIQGKEQPILVQHRLSKLQLEVMIAGVLINWVKENKEEKA